MSKEFIMALIAQALDRVLTDEFLAKSKAELIKVMQDASKRTDNKVDDYVAKQIARFLEV